jgi:hypothetical protein
VPQLKEDQPEDFSREIRGEITSDPAEGVSVGLSLHFEAGLLTSALDAKASWIRDWQTFEGMLLSMHFNVDGRYSVDGSAVLVAPGIALSATHVITPHREAFTSGRASCLCIGLTRHGMQIWRLTHFTQVNASDLTILGLTYAAALPPDLLFHQATISTRLPGVDEWLSLCGFRARTFEQTSDHGLACHGNVLMCRGRVTRQFPNGRDRSLLPWACLEVACPAWGGMSGGPVFDESGFLVGLVCSSVADEAHEGPAYVSLLWPSLGYPFSGGWPTGLLPDPHITCGSRKSVLDQRPRCD